MKIERLAQNKLKITLSGDDLRQWNIDIRSLTADSEELKDIFWSIIKTAEEETGFVIDDSQLMVEAISRNDSFIMLITKIDQPAEKITRVKTRKKKTPVSSQLVFSFASLDDATEACKHIENRFVGTSSLYKYQGTYYLVLDTINEYLACDLDTMLSEFGKKAEEPAILCGLLSERGELLIPGDAIADMASFF